MQYEVRWVAITQYYHDVLGVKMPKEEAKTGDITLERHEYLAVSIKDFSFRRLWYISTFRVRHAIMLSLCRCVQIGVMEKTSPGRHWWICGVVRMEPGRL
jgi:hypothetical protein